MNFQMNILPGYNLFFVILFFMPRYIFGEEIEKLNLFDGHCIDPYEVNLHVHQHKKYLLRWNGKGFDDGQPCQLQFYSKNRNNVVTNWHVCIQVQNQTYANCNTTITVQNGFTREKFIGSCTKNLPTNWCSSGQYGVFFLSSTAILWNSTNESYFQILVYGKGDVELSLTVVFGVSIPFAVIILFIAAIFVVKLIRRKKSIPGLIHSRPQQKAKEARENECLQIHVHKTRQLMEQKDTERYH